MKTMICGWLAAALLTGPTVAHSATLDFRFTFTNRAEGYSGTITGVVRGLSDDATSSATSLEIFTNTDGFGVGAYVPSFNEWSVSSGAITNYMYQGDAVSSCCFLILVSLASNGTALINGAWSMVDSTRADIQFTQVSSVPEPSSLALVGLGLVGVGLTRRREAD